MCDITLLEKEILRNSYLFSNYDLLKQHSFHFQYFQIYILLAVLCAPADRKLLLES